LFDCECGHEFETIISDITNNSSWCSYCSTPPKKLCSNNDCSKCFNKSFASHEKSQFWASKNTSHPRQIFKKTAAKYWFDCDKCNNSFESTISHISKGTWCPKCRYKTEDKLFKILLTIYPSITAQVKFDWCKDKKHLPFDFVLDDLKIIVELDGENHFIQVAKWKTPEHNRKRDLYKMKCANENGYSIIRILQDDIWHNRYEWLKDLTNNIDKIVADNRVQNIYMCKNDEYKDFDMLIPNL
jgi:very-short-patch-repair endonuclease